MRQSALAALMLAAVLVPLPALAWGAHGHRIINEDAARSLPDTMPAFLRTPAAIAEITALGPEPDRLRDAGRPRDADIDPAHFLDLDDDGTIAGVLPVMQLPPTREAYDTAVRAGKLPNGKPATEYGIGYLPYEIADDFEDVAKDFAIWRVDRYGEAHAAGAADRAFFAADRALREKLTLRDIGYWGHFVGDGSQPLHVSVHFNGWGDYPNPHDYTQSHQIHAKFETAFVNAHMTAAGVLPHVGPYAASAQPLLTQIGAYLTTTNSFVPNVYQLEGAGAFDAATPQALSFTADRLAAGAQMFRDLIVEAYAASSDLKVGYPGPTVRDVESGKVPVPTPADTNHQ